jgi:hypothetical protein
MISGTVSLKMPMAVQHQVSHELFIYETDMIFSVQMSDYSFVDHAVDVHELYEAPLLSSKKCLQKLHKVTGETVLGVFCYA